MGLAEDILRLEQALHELVVKYEQYFAGSEKREPLGLLAEVEQLARRYQNSNISNTMLRFKYNSLLSTLGVHRQKWCRINRLIDEGKYQRDRFRMALHFGERPGADPAAAPSPRAAGPLADSALDKLYQEYLEARTRCNLPNDNVTRDKMAAALARQLPTIKDKRGTSDLDLHVVIEDGKPRIKVRRKN